MGGETYDVAIVGAGPAGATASLVLAKNERRVVLVDRDTFPRSGESLGWLNVKAAPMLAELGVAIEPLLTSGFREVAFHTADFSKGAKPHFEKTAGYLIDRMEFNNLLVEAAVSSGAEIVSRSPVADVQLKENCAVLELKEGQLESRLLVLASGRQSDLLDRAGFTREGGASSIWSAHVEAALETPPRGAPRLSVVLGLDRVGSFGLCCVSDKRLSLTVNWMGEQAEAIPVLVRLCRAAFACEVVPLDLSAAAESAVLARSPASVALDMDTHVGKHTLLIGDAGGFVSAASNEGIYPAMWSAQIAAEVADAALKSEHSQDELMTFDSKWRMQMADYLRAPNTDSQFLIPLIFSNQPMADRMGAAFFSGENI